MIIQFSRKNYNSNKMLAATFMTLALILTLGVRRGEAVVG
jgi:hypothetical protein